MNTVFIVSFLILISYSILCTITTIKQFERSQKAEKYLNFFQEKFQNISDKIQESSEALNKDNLTHAFETDDEVGIFFRNLKDIQDTLENLSLYDAEKTFTDEQ